MFDGRRTKMKDVSVALKSLIFIGDYMHSNYGPYHFAKASTAFAHLADEYNRAFEQYDVLIMPTLPKTPCKIPAANATISDKIKAASGHNVNTAIFNVTGHPALSLNCEFYNEFPVGLMIIGKHDDDVGVLNAGSIFESVFKDYLLKKPTEKH